MARFCVITGCPCNPDLAPYIELVRRGASRRLGRKVALNSIYRGQDARTILHRHGKSTQAEIHRDYPAISNPPGRSTHELRSDGVAYGGPVGRRLPWWGQGMDVNDDAVDAMVAVARKFGWQLFRPYSRGVEHHHLNFRHRPHPHSRVTRWRLSYLRRRLPRR